MRGALPTKAQREGDVYPLAAPLRTRIVAHMNTNRGTRQITKAAIAALATAGLGVGVVAFALGDAAISASSLTAIGTGDPSGHPAMANAGGSFNNLPSPNWAGPVLVGSVYDQVLTSFVVPPTTCSPSQQAESDASFWVGLDGFGADPKVSPTVEQAGIRVQCIAGTSTYFPWTEAYPAGEDDINPSQFQVKAGDTVAVRVVVSGTTDTYTLDDETTGATFTRSATAPQGATNASAECIAESPGQLANNQFYPLPDFGTVTFNQCVAQAVSPTVATCDLVSGQGCLSGSQRFLLSLADPSTESNAESMSVAGDGFAVTWHHA